MSERELLAAKRDAAMEREHCVRVARVHPNGWRSEDVAAQLVVEREAVRSEMLSDIGRHMKTIHRRDRAIEVLEAEVRRLKSQLAKFREVAGG